MRSSGFPVTALVLLVGLLAAPVQGQLCGDCNLDGSLTVLDALTAAQAAVGGIMLGEAQLVLCDIDSDSDVDILDALLMAQVAAGLAMPFDCQIPLEGEDPVDSLIVGNIDATAEGDWDQDGFDDIAVLDNAAGTISFYRSDGAGGFSLGATLPTIPVTVDLSPGAPECDGIIDLSYLVPSPPQLRVGVNDAIVGSFSFTFQTFALTAVMPVALDFFDADGDPDGVEEYAAIADGGGTAAVIRKQSVFASADYDLEFLPDLGGAQIDIALGEMNGDMTPDIVAVLDNGDVNVALSTGVDVWAAPTTIGTVALPGAGVASNRILEVIDLTGLNGDDIIVASATVARVFENVGGAFLAGVDFAAPGTIVALAVADMDQDAPAATPELDLDVLAAYQSSNHAGLVSFLNVRPGGSTTTPARLGQCEYLVQRTDGPALGVLPPDHDGDGYPDGVLIGSLIASRKQVRETGTTTQPEDIVIADLDGDLIADLAASTTGAGGNVTVLIGDGTGGFTSTMNLIGPPGLGTASRVAVADLDGDGNLDIAAIGTGLGVAVFQGDGMGGFSLPAIFIGIAGLPTSIAVANVSGSSTPDIILGCSSCGLVEVLESLGAGAFLRLSTVVGPILPLENAVSVSACDADNDGEVDDIALVPLAATDRIQVYTNNRTGPTAPAQFVLTSDQFVGAGVDLVEIVSADFNADGFFDHAALDIATETVRIAFATGATGLAFQAPVDLRPQASPGRIVEPRRIAVGNFIGAATSAPDLVVSTVGTGICSIVGDPGGDFRILSRRIPSGVPSGLAVGDMDGGTVNDVVSAVDRRSSVRVFLGE